VKFVHAARDLSRLTNISKVLIRHGFGEIVARLGQRRFLSGRPPAADRSGGGHDTEPPPSSPDAALASIATAEEVANGKAAKQQLSTAVRIRMVLEDLGPSFVKLGQIMSTRPDVVPADVIGELKKLQDSVPPIEFDEIQTQVERSLSAPLEDLFESFDRVPLAAGSIAQVHRARLRHDGQVRDVVVKVQRPGIAKTIASDVDILHTFAALLERTVPESRTFQPVGLVQQFDRAITNELDFSLEAENAGIFAQNFQAVPYVTFPRVFEEATAKQVLTLEFLPGEKVYEAVAAGHSGKKLARIALEVMVKQIFEDGFFHADPHPGNAIILGPPDNPVLGLIDLGMVGRLSPRIRDLTTDMMISAFRRDYDGIADAIYAIGNPSHKIDRVAFRQEVGLRAEKYLGRPMDQIQLSGLVRDVVQGATNFGLKIPTDFTLVAKALMTLEGVGKDLAPDLELFAEAKPHFIALLKKRYSPERLTMDLLRRLERLGDATDSLPLQVQEVMEDLRLGRLAIQTVDPSTNQAADLLGRRIFVGMVNSAMLIAGAWLISTNYVVVGMFFLLVCVTWLAVYALAEIYRAIRNRWFAGKRTPRALR